MMDPLKYGKPRLPTEVEALRHSKRHARGLWQWRSDDYRRDVITRMIPNELVPGGWFHGDTIQPVGNDDTPVPWPDMGPDDARGNVPLNIWHLDWLDRNHEPLAICDDLKQATINIRPSAWWRYEAIIDPSRRAYDEAYALERDAGTPSPWDADSVVTAKNHYLATERQARDALFAELREQLEAEAK